MNIARLLFSALAVAAVSAHASKLSTPISLKPIGVHADFRLVFDCSAEHLPSMRSVGALLDTNSGSRIYAQREHLVSSAHRECRRGATRVVFVRDPTAMPMHVIATVTR